MNFEDCKDEILIRNIKSLYHFTCKNSLKNIFKYGIRSKKWLEENNVKVNSIRMNSVYYEGCEDGISLTVEFPNYKMLYKLRCDFPSEVFVVIRISVEELVNHDFRVYSSNASCNYGNTEVSSFSEIFTEVGRQDIPPNYPTNPQAEIKLLGEILEIKNIYVNSEQDKRDLIREFPDQEKLFIVSSELFGAREDYYFWQNRK